MSGNKAFVGKWLEEEKTGFDNFAAALGLPEDKKKFFKDARTEITYTHINNDNWKIAVGMQGVGNMQEIDLVLGNGYKSKSLDGSSLQSVMKADGEKFVEKHIYESMDNMELDITRHIEGDKMIVVTKVGNLEMKSKYGRIP